MNEENDDLSMNNRISFISFCDHVLNDYLYFCQSSFIHISVQYFHRTVVNANR